MAEFCSSCFVMDTVRHHAKACSHFCFIFWLGASFGLSQIFGNEYKYIFDHCSWVNYYSRLWYENRNDKSPPHTIVFMTLFFPFTAPKRMRWWASLMGPVLWNFLFVWCKWNKDGSDQENENEYFVFEASKTLVKQSVTLSERAPRCCGCKMLSSCCASRSSRTRYQ